jgi:hypothetical protein
LGGKYIDITGEVYGKLTVIEFIGSDRKNKTTLWKCQCSCENKTILIVSSHSLRRKKKGRN